MEGHLSEKTCWTRVSRRWPVTSDDVALSENSLDPPGLEADHYKSAEDLAIMAVTGGDLSCSTLKQKTKPNLTIYRGINRSDLLIEMWGNDCLQC